MTDLSSTNSEKKISDLIQNSVSEFLEVASSDSPSNIKSATPESTMDVPGQSALPNLSRQLKQGAPLIILILFNLIYSHTVSIILLIGFFLVFYWSNSFIEEQSILQKHRSLGRLIFLITFLFLNCFLSFPVINEFWLFKLSSLSTWMSTVSSFWKIVFMVAVMDFLVKFLTLSVKCLLIIVPANVFPSQKRLASDPNYATAWGGKRINPRPQSVCNNVRSGWPPKRRTLTLLVAGLFFVSETLSQTIRCILPFPEWMKYILVSSTCMATFICIFVGILYSVMKLSSLRSRCKLLVVGWRSWGEAQIIGRQVVGDGRSPGCCPICRESCCNPVELSCSHIFCHNCCQTWFAWGKHCPVCSTNHVSALVMGLKPSGPPLVQVAPTQSEWRRGSTDPMLTVF